MSTLVTNEMIQAWIQAGLPDAEVQVTGDGHHFEAQVVSAQFAGLSMIAQHRLVYATLGERMGRDIHALALETRAPQT